MGLFVLNRRSTFNRTILELKQKNPAPSPKADIAFNRTILELKLVLFLIDVKKNGAFNRTILELKLF